MTMQAAASLSTSNAKLRSSIAQDRHHAMASFDQTVRATLLHSVVLTNKVR
jgi:hypothetical protein